MIRPENQPELFREAGHSRKDIALSAGWIPGMLSQKKAQLKNERMQTRMELSGRRICMRDAFSVFNRLKSTETDPRTPGKPGKASVEKKQPHLAPGRLQNTLWLPCLQ